MLKKYYGIFVSSIIIVLFSLYLYNDYHQLREFKLNKNYFDTNINIKIYTNYSKGKNIINKINNLCMYYDKLIDKNQKYNNIVNLYVLQKNKSKTNYKISKELYNLIKYGIKLKEESKGFIDINEGIYLDEYRNYIDLNKKTIEIPKNVNKVKILENNSILNNKPNIDFHKVIRGYLNDEIKKLLKEEKIDKYIINIGGNVSFGKHYNKDKYKFALESSYQRGEYYYYLNLENKAVANMQIDELVKINNTYYHLYLDSKRKKPVNNYKDVVVISDDAKTSEKYKNILYQLSIDDGKNYIDGKKIEVIWYTFDNKIYTYGDLKKYK